MKRVIVLILILSLIVTNGLIVCADEKASPSEPKKIVVYLKPDLTVTLNDEVQNFRDANGKVVYPIIYNGSTYLPVRAISTLMKEPIEWDGASKTIFIGKTLSNPNKTLAVIDTDTAIKTANNVISMKPRLESAYLKPDVLVMYDFILQNFEDVNGKQVYPIIYNGTAYLPVRAISALMKKPIVWDGAKQTVSIIDNTEIQTETDVTQTAEELKKLFEREEVLYFEATAKTTSLNAAVSLEDKMLIATTISENYINAQNLTLEIKAIDTSAFTGKENAAHEKLTAFAGSAEYYILVLENIAYLAAQDSDYSMLAETFLYFALDSQSKMEEARAQIQLLFEST